MFNRKRKERRHLFDSQNINQFDVIVILQLNYSNTRNTFCRHILSNCILIMGPKE